MSYNTVHVHCGISIQTSPEGLPLYGWGARMRDLKGPKMNLFNLKEDWNVLLYQPIISLEIEPIRSRHLRPIIQSETRKKNQSEEGCLPLRPRPNNIYSDRIIIGILSFDRPWWCSPARDAAKNWQRSATWPDIKRLMQFPHRPIPVGYATRCSVDQTTERGMKRPTATAWPAEYVVSTSTDWTS